MKNKSSDINGWDRDQVTIRLVKGRRAKMKELARGLDDGLTPTDVIDWALNEAARDRSQPLEVTYALDELTEAVGRMDRLLALQLDRMSDLLESSAETTARLTNAIAEVAATGASLDQDEDFAPLPRKAIPMPSVAQWLAKEFPPQCSKVMAIASWQIKERAGPSAVHIEFSFDVLSMDGRPVSIGKSLGHTARLASIEIGTPFANMDLHSRALFSFEKNGAGAWNLQASRCDENGKDAGAIGMCRV